MKSRILIFTVLIFSHLLFSAEKAPLKIDATTDESLAASFVAIASTLNPEKSQALSNASAAIVSDGMKNKLSEKTMREKFHNKTADEIIEMGKKISPTQSDFSLKINGTSKEEFSKSLVPMLTALSPEDQNKFAQALAFLMIQSQSKNESEETFMKSLNGKSAKDIILLRNDLTK